MKITPAVSKYLSLRCLVAAAVALSLAACGGKDSEPEKPNVLFILADDMGYSDIGAFGSEIATPNLDALVSHGRVLTNFRTAPSCAPTRAMLLSGADSHRVGVAQLPDNTLSLLAAKNAPFGVSFGHDNVPEGYAGYLLDNVVTLPQLLRDAGYRTSMAGKWHLSNEFRTTPTPGTYFVPKAYPNKKGFERSYALLNGAGAHFAPVPGRPLGRYDNATYTEDDVEFPSTALPADFYSTKTFTDKLISYIDSSRGSGKPFFAYLAYTAPHWPLQAPDADIAAQAGRYDEGYDVIRARRLARMKALGILPQNFADNPGLASVAGGGPGKKRWSELTARERALQARGMEVYAAMVSNMDGHVGRLVKYLKDTGQYDNTLIVFTADNGSDSAPATGGSITSNTVLADMGKAGSNFGYGERWAEVSSAPFRLWKTFTGAEGSISVPTIVKLPGNLKAAQPLTAPTLVQDLMPKILDFAGVAVPRGTYNGRAIVPITGVSLRTALLSSTDSPQVRPASEPIVLEYFGQGYVLRQDGWKLGRALTPGESAASYAQVPWRLFNTATDRGETQDRTAERPDIVRDLLAQWDKYVADDAVLILATPPPAKGDPNAL